jgi:hypothetical protein
MSRANCRYCRAVGDHKMSCPTRGEHRERAMGNKQEQQRCDVLRAQTTEPTERDEHGQRQ